MSQASDYLENALINHLFRNSALTSPTTVYAALFTTTPNDAANSGAEIHTSGGYARQAVTFGPPLTGSTGNTSTVTFGPATAPWGTVTAFAIFDNATSGSGNMLVWNTLNSNVSITTSDSAQFASGTLQVTVL
jgi:hypothetical protein